MANRTTGPERGEHGRHGQRPWRETPDILARMQEGARLRSHGLTGPQIALQLGISVPVVYEDRDRLLELRREQASAAVDEHIENLRQQAAEIRRDLEGTDRRSLNVGQLRGLLSMLPGPTPTPPISTRERRRRPTGRM